MKTFLTRNSTHWGVNRFLYDGILKNMDVTQYGKLFDVRNGFVITNFVDAQGNGRPRAVAPTRDVAISDGLFGAYDDFVIINVIGTHVNGQTHRSAPTGDIAR